MAHPPLRQWTHCKPSPLRPRPARLAHTGRETGTTACLSLSFPDEQTKLRNAMMTDYYLHYFRTTWPDTDNVVISLYQQNPDDGTSEQVGIIELQIFKTGDHQGKCYLWNLQLREHARRRGYATALLREAESIARQARCRALTLEWSLRESPRWVFQWYVRQGFDEREFGRDRALMAKEIK